MFAQFDISRISGIIFMIIFLVVCAWDLISNSIASSIALMLQWLLIINLTIFRVIFDFQAGNSFLTLDLIIFAICTFMLGMKIMKK